ncbi:MAG TPA: hypothetical protein PLV21_02525 [Cyclobacteriaceae bacterium]|nr:hypothetical protein [Cyclobacteriaceae bacterium]HRJ80733.1 hypothetical protein [Cyclobacteriaceae bacterium]
MIRDIEIPEVKNVTVVIARKQQPGETVEWKVYLINKNPFPIENALIASKGYGEKNGEEQQTSVLRHFIETVPAESAALVEPIDPAVFHLNNEYWVSYYIGTTIFDKRFVFVPDSIREDNLIFIKELNTEGILHS